MGVIASSIATVQAASVLGSAGVAQNQKNKNADGTGKAVDQAENKDAKAETKGTTNSSTAARMATATANTKFPTSPYPPASNSNNQPMPPMGGAAAGMGGMGALGQGAAALAGMKRNKGGGGGSGGGGGGGCNGGGCNGGGGGSPGMGGGPNFGRGNGGGNPGVGGGQGFGANGNPATGGANPNNGWGDAIDFVGQKTGVYINANANANTNAIGLNTIQGGDSGALTKAKEQGVILLDFSAKWCGPCQQTKPIIDDLKRKGQPIQEIDIDANPQLAKKFNIQSIPAFVAARIDPKTGELVAIEQAAGLTSGEKLLAMLDHARNAKKEADSKSAEKPEAKDEAGKKASVDNAPKEKSQSQRTYEFLEGIMDDDKKFNQLSPKQQRNIKDLTGGNCNGGSCTTNAKYLNDGNFTDGKYKIITSGASAGKIYSGTKDSKEPTEERHLVNGNGKPAESLQEFITGIGQKIGAITPAPEPKAAEATNKPVESKQPAAEEKIPEKKPQDPPPEPRKREDDFA